MFPDNPEDPEATDNPFVLIDGHSENLSPKVKFLYSDNPCNSGIQSLHFLVYLRKPRRPLGEYDFAPR